MKIFDFEKVENFLKIPQSFAGFSKFSKKISKISKTVQAKPEKIFKFLKIFEKFSKIWRFSARSGKSPTPFASAIFGPEGAKNLSQNR